MKPNPKLDAACRRYTQCRAADWDPGFAMIQYGVLDLVGLDHARRGDERLLSDAYCELMNQKRELGKCRKAGPA